MRSWLTALPSFALPRPDSRRESPRYFGIWIEKQELRVALGRSPIQASTRQKEGFTVKRTMQRVQRMALVGCAHAVIGAHENPQKGNQGTYTAWQAWHADLQAGRESVGKENPQPTSLKARFWRRKFQRS
jgi:hypothetical protein